MTMRKLLSVKETANILGGKSVSWLYQNYKKLHKEKGFPLPVSGFGCVWDATAIENWLNVNLPNNLKFNDNNPQSKGWEYILNCNAANL